MKTLIVLSQFLAFQAYASCGTMQLDLKGSSNIDLSGNPSPVSSIQVQRSSSSSCDFFITCDYGSAGAYNSRTVINNSTSSYKIPVQIYTNANRNFVFKSSSDASSNNHVIAANLQGTTSSINVNFYPVLGNLDYQRFGTFQDTYTLRLYDGLVGAGSLKDTRTFVLKYTMPKSIDLSIVGSSAPFDSMSTNKTMNFGVLSNSAQLNFDLVLKFNAGYRIQFSSSNNGSMSNTSTPGTVPYTLTINSNAVNLVGSKSNPITYASGSGVSPSGGLRFTNSIKIGSIDNSPAGPYQDTITISVNTTE